MLPATLRSACLSGRSAVSFQQASLLFSSGGKGGGHEEETNSEQHEDLEDVGDDLVPPPTWSIASLELDKQHEPLISDEEFRRLAKLALLDVRKLPVDRLKRDLSNMMHMIRQVQSFQTEGDEDEDFDQYGVDLYDVPRGVTSAPLRRHGNDDDVGETTTSAASDDHREESDRVWESLLKPKTTLVGAHSYFAIATGKRSKKDS